MIQKIIVYWNERMTFSFSVNYGAAIDLDADGD